MYRFNRFNISRKNLVTLLLSCFLATVLVVTFLFLQPAVMAQPQPQQLNKTPAVETIMVDADTKSVRQGVWRVYLYTIAPSDLQIYSLWGHTALRVQNEQKQIDWMFDFGNFFLNEQLVYGMVKGSPQFFLGVTDPQLFLLQYSAQNRSIYRQQIILNDAQGESLYETLQMNLILENRFYAYDHFSDNCTTRIRDLLDSVLNGILKKNWQGQSLPISQRSAAMELIEVQPFAWYYGQMYFRPNVYERTDVWGWAFLPMVLMQELEHLRVAWPHLPLGSIEKVYSGSDEKFAVSAWQWFALSGVFFLAAFVLASAWFLTGLQKYFRFLAHFTYFSWLGITGLFSITMLLFLAGHHGWDVRQSNFFWMTYSPLIFVILFWHIFMIREPLFRWGLETTKCAHIRICAWLHVLAGALAAWSILLDIPVQQKVFFHALPAVILHSLAFLAMSRLEGGIHQKNSRHRDSWFSSSQVANGSQARAK